MKKMLIKLTGLMITAAVIMSYSGIAMATEAGDTENNAGTTQEETAGIPDEEAAKDEVPAPAEKPAEEPADGSAEKTAEEPSKEAETEPAKAETPADPAIDTDEKVPEAGDQNDADRETLSLEKTVDVKISQSNDELAEGYITRAFGRSSYAKRSYNYAAQFDEPALSVYNTLNTEIAKIAAGERTSTIITIEKDFTASDLGLANLNDLDAAFNAAISKLGDFNSLFDALVRSNPYNLYWFDKATEDAFSVGYSGSSNGYVLTLEITYSLLVAAEYKGSGDYTVDSKWGTSVAAARSNALAVVDQYASLDDYKKLKAYKDAVCNLTDYNQPAADDDNTPYGNPWQMIWVFDGDPETRVVCEGYSKAFQFLCDSSSFRSSEVYALSVSGICGGPHMWNVVHMEDGNYYLADITNCDSGFPLFLRGKKSASTGGYEIDAGNGNLFRYIYDSDGLNPDLPLEDYAYNPNPGPLTEPEFTTMHSMILAGRIGLKFLVDFPDDFDGSDCYMIFTSSDGRTARVDYSDSETGEGFGNKRAFTFYMNAIELADAVTATLHYGSGKTTVDIYSAVNYINDAKANSSLDNYFNRMNLLYKLQAYGYYMQKSGWTDGRIHTEIPVPASNLIEDNIPKTIIVDGCLEETVSAVSSYGVNLTPGNSVIADVKFSLALNSQSELRLAVKPAAGVTITSDASEYSVVSINGEDYYVFTIPEIGPKKLGENKTIIINTDHGEAGISVAVMYYVKQVLGSSSFETKEKNAMIAYYNYYNAATMYNGN